MREKLGFCIFQYIKVALWLMWNLKVGYLSRFWAIRQLFTKNGVQNRSFRIFKKFKIVQTPPPDEVLGKVSLFWILFFLVNGVDNPLSNLTWTWKYFLSIDWFQESLILLDGLLLLAPLQSVAFGGASRSVHSRIQHKSAYFWVSVDIYALHRVACKIWRWFVHLGFEK
jgi:hypothetical protein